MKTNEQVLGLYVSTTDGVSSITSDSDSTRRNRPGELAFVQAREGYRVYRYMKAEEAFAAGQVAMISAVLDDADVDAAATTSEKTLTATGDFTAGEFGNSDPTTFPDAYVTIDANGTTGLGQTRAILRNSANILTVDKSWSVALNTSNDYVTYSPNYVSLCDTDDVSVDASAVMGVAISAISDENWGWFQVKGFCPLVRGIGSTDAFVRGEVITPSSTAGACKGTTNAGLAAADLSHAFGIALHGYANGDSAGIGVAAILDCRWAY